MFTTLRALIHGAQEQKALSVPAAHAWKRVDGSPWIDLHHADSGSLLRLPGLADFLIDATGRSVQGWPVPGLDAEACHQLYLANIKPMALSRQGKLVLHAAAIAVDGEAIVFVGVSGRGKSTLATSFAVDGHPLIADDGLAVEPDEDRYLAMPGETAVRLWRDSERELLADSDAPASSLGYVNKRRIEVGSCHAETLEPMPIRAIFLLGDNPQAELAIRPMQPAEGTMALIQHSFLLDIGNPQRHARQLRQTAALASGTLMATLDFPRDYTLLPEVKEAILAYAFETA